MDHLRPREKLAQFGSSALTSTELISLILGSGSKKMSVEQISEEVSKCIVGQEVTLSKLQRIHGIGLAKAAQLVAMVEFVERLRPLGRPVIRHLSDVLEQVGELRSAQREHLICLYLDTRLQLLVKETLSIGSVNQSAIEARDVFSVMKNLPITALIFVHNHPSGDPRPSAADIAFTQKMCAACELLGVTLLDHVILGKTLHYSLKEHGALASSESAEDRKKHYL